jgi:hypothetical protein
MKRLLLCVLACFCIGTACAEDVSSQLKAMQAQIENLARVVEQQHQLMSEQKQQIDDQKKELESLKQSSPASAPVIDDILKKYDLLEDRLEERTAMAIKIASRKKPNDLNMAIGGAVDTSFAYSTGSPQNYDRPIHNDFRLRGAELVFTADIDPYFKSYMVVNAAGDAANNDEAVLSVEEAAIFTTSLKYTQVKGGRFFVPFGRFSMIHDHDLPFVTRPRSLDTYVGGESAGDGVQVQALLPIKHFLQITGGAFNKVGANFPLLNGQGHSRDGAEMTYFLKGLTSFDICTDHTVELGVSALETPESKIHRDLTNLELTYRWHPKNGSALRQRLIFGTELMRNNMRTQFQAQPPPNPVFTGERRTGFGGYGYVEYFLTRHWSTGGRVDWFQNVNPTLHTERADQTYTLFATYNFSEFSRLRFEANRHEFFDGRQGNEFLLQWTVFMGAHVHDFNGR